MIQRRRGLKQSQETVAHNANLTVRYYGDIERGKRRISIVTGKRIAAALGCRLQDLLDVADGLEEEPTR